MKTGKLPETMLRTIAGKARTPSAERKEVLDGFGIAEDCAALKLNQGEAFVIVHDLIQGIPQQYMGRLAAHISASHMAAEGGEPIGIAMTALFPPDTKKYQIEQVIGEIQETCARLSMVILEGHTEVTEAVNTPLLSIHGAGKIRKDQKIPGKAKPGQDLILKKYIGLSGTGMAADFCREELSRRFPSMFLKEARECMKQLSVEKEAEILADSECYRKALGETGIYGALWEMSRTSGVGLQADIEKIPVKQHTIEICEYYNLNPYQLRSEGSMLIAADCGQQLIRELEAEGIHGTIIGQTTDSREKLIYRQGRAANLEITKQDEFQKIFMKTI